jgi:hypothetical protein
MSLRKIKSCYLNNCLHFLECAVLFVVNQILFFGIRTSAVRKTNFTMSMKLQSLSCTSQDRFVKLKLVLSCSFWCHQFHHCHIYEFGLTFCAAQVGLRCLTNPPQVGLKQHNKGLNRFIEIIVMNMVKP